MGRAGTIRHPNAVLGRGGHPTAASGCRNVEFFCPDYGRSAERSATVPRGPSRRPRDKRDRSRTRAALDPGRQRTAEGRRARLLRRTRYGAYVACLCTPFLHY
ncbi:hypothetical protein HPB50_011806 [Hyalomma asiaticum]|uniref:Uncharacterized protein n=1 Tax=Hyalomma asiaticum TaxID=266040 RepID=A0ACB7S816_HYAAI|nr:hypothetical protein HPB50_011806 [Hyalomma asiaticum]